MTNPQIKAIENNVSLGNRGAMYHAVRAAGELGILKSLAAGQKTAEQLATELKLDAGAVAQLMAVASRTELVDQYDADFALAPLGRLIPEAFFDFGDDYLRELSDFVRDGKPRSSHEAKYRASWATQEWTLTPAALDLLQLLDIGKARRGLRVLDLGCGSGVFGVALAHRDPDSKITMFDVPAQIQRSRTTAESVGISNQFTWMEADPVKELDRLDDQQPFDLIVAANYFRWLGADQQSQMLTKLAGYIEPEGELAMVDIFPGQPEGDLHRAVVELETGVCATGSMIDPIAMKEQITAAGFRQVQYAHLPAPPHLYGVLLATK